MAPPQQGGRLTAVAVAVLLALCSAPIASAQRSMSRAADAPCTLGYSPDPASNVNCIACRIGTYGNAVDSCAPCLGDEYTDTFGQTTCKTCTMTTVRRDINSLNETSLRRFRRAMKKMKSAGWAPAGKVPVGVSPQEYVANVHGGECTLCDGTNTGGGFSNWTACGSFGGWCAHGYVSFGEWHRPYVLQFEYWLQEAEKELRRTDDPYNVDVEFNYCPPLGHPYWPWSDVPGTPITLANSITSLLVGIPEAYSVAQAYVDSPTVLEQNPLTGSTPSCGQATYRSSDFAAALQLGGLSRAPYQLTNLGLAAATHSDISTADGAACSGTLEGPHNFIHVATGGFLRDGVGSGPFGGGQMGYNGVAAFDPIFFAHHSNVDRLLESYYVINDNRNKATASFASSPGSPESELNIPALNQEPATIPVDEGGGNWYDFCQYYNRGTTPMLPFQQIATRDGMADWDYRWMIPNTSAIAISPGTGPCSDETGKTSPDSRSYRDVQYWVTTPTTSAPWNYQYDRLATWASSTGACHVPTFEFILTVGHAPAAYLAFIDIPAADRATFFQSPFATLRDHNKLVGYTALFKPSKAGHTTLAFIDVTKGVERLGLTHVNADQVYIVKYSIHGKKSKFNGPLQIIQPAQHSASTTGAPSPAAALSRFAVAAGALVVSAAAFLTL